jgi:hypothetical protein
MDAEINCRIYRRTGVLWREGDPNGNLWQLRFMRMFDMATDSGLFKSDMELVKRGHSLRECELNGPGERLVPLIEAKMVHLFNHRFGDYRDHPEGSENLILPDVPENRLIDPHYSVNSRYWMTQEAVSERLRGVWSRGWLLGWRDITKPQNERTAIASVIPRHGVGDKFLLMLPAVEPPLVACLYASLASFAFDYTARQKVGATNLKYFTMRQLPVLPPMVYTSQCAWDCKLGNLHDWLLPRVLELTYTAWDLEAFAADCGWSGPPFRWDEERRFLLRSELDAAFFHLYLGPQSEWQQQPEALTRAFPTPRHAVSYIMDTFPIVKRKDESKHGHYRTQATILQIYDALGEAMQTGKPYQTLLNPPPADAACCHPPRPTA